MAGNDEIWSGGKIKERGSVLRFIQGFHYSQIKEGLFFNKKEEV